MVPTLAKSGMLVLIGFGEGVIYKKKWDIGLDK